MKKEILNKIDNVLEYLNDQDYNILIRDLEEAKQFLQAEDEYKKMWEKLTKELERREMSGKTYGITFILHSMQDIKKEFKK